jgi:hypothetical protein
MFKCSEDAAKRYFSKWIQTKAFSSTFSNM